MQTTPFCLCAKFLSCIFLHCAERRHGDGTNDFIFSDLYYLFGKFLGLR